ncbi:hypothetical protein OOJ09_02015 [Mesorhizobium qingshengii]|uniref:Uncharacterized protein n=1 Tax=Mesorhizobium qingshengii TaxID=1165689 RepID=A0ABT4QMZ3_9HYPH|nr:hypothetical protein [Mesorhizobium qingshengii]MCZ8542940.1 hypothetical protein [Mesorhizobium qingshengii]
MTLTLSAPSVITEIEHYLACAGPGRDKATTALRNDRYFQHNQKKTQEGNER